MNIKIKLIASAALAMAALTSCGVKTDTPSAPQSLSSPISSSVSSSAPTSIVPESSSTPVITPAVVETQTKQIEGFSSTDFDNGEVYVNEAILKVGCTVGELNAHLEKTKTMRLYSETNKAEFDAKMNEEDHGASGSEYIYFMARKAQRLKQV